MAIGNKNRKVIVILRIPTSVAVKYNSDFLMRINELPQTSTNGSNIVHDISTLFFITLAKNMAQSY